jgi:hypothetical protein
MCKDMVQHNESDWQPTSWNLKPDINLPNVSKHISYLTETKLDLRYEEKPVHGGKSFTANKNEDILLVYAPRSSRLSFW